MPDQHELVYIGTARSGAGIWQCPRCDHRMLTRWQPTFQAEVLREGDPGVAYRTREEIAAWKERDPVRKLKDDAIAARMLTAEDFEKVDSEVAAVLEDAAQFALASALEDESTALRHVFAD